MRYKLSAICVIAFLSSFTLPIFAQEVGIAAFYSDDFQGKRTGSGEPYEISKLTAAHRTLPYGTKVKITRLDNNRSVEVRINDRGPYIKNRIIDLSHEAANRLGSSINDQVKIRVEVLSADYKSVEAIPISNDVTPTIIERPVIKEELNAKGGNNDEKEEDSIKVSAKKEINTPVIKKTSEKPKPVPPKPTPKEEKTEKPEKALKGKSYNQYNLYKIQLLEPEFEGYGVQVASINNYSNLLKKVAELQDDYFKNILIYAEKGKTSNTYKIILGPFPDKPTAESYQIHAKKKGLKGFIVPLEKFKK